MYSTSVSIGQLEASLGSRDLVVVDCRFNLMEPEAGRGLWLTSRIPGARYAHLDDDLAGAPGADTGRHPLPDPAEFGRWLQRAGITSQSQVVAYDDAGGAIAARLWWLLRAAGHEAVAVLDGGWQAWISEFPVDDGEPRDPEVIAARYSVAFSALPILPLPAIPGFLDSAGVLFDARDSKRFAGLVEPIDPVAGHVPGAINLPFQSLLDANGRFLPADQLRAQFETHNPGAAGTACMCGSGVTACHLILGAVIAGLAPPALFVGSWSEWIRDAARPVAAEPDS